MNDDDYYAYAGANSSESVRQAIRYALVAGALVLGLLLTPATRSAIFSIAGALTEPKQSKPCRST